MNNLLNKFESKKNDIINFYFKIFPMRVMRYHLYRIDKFIKKASVEYNFKGKKILDVGAGNSPYVRCFGNSDYMTQDVVQNVENSIDFIGDISEGLPLIKDNSFDCIICTQVLEHIKNPQNAFNEFYRILSPGGKLFLTTHLCFEEHMMPNDFFRFTKYGLKLIGESAGFEVLSVTPEGGIFQTLAHIINTLPIQILFKKGVFYYLYILLFTPLMFIFNLICYFLDFLDKEKVMTINYECICIKK